MESHEYRLRQDDHTNQELDGYCQMLTLLSKHTLAVIFSAALMTVSYSF